MPTLKWNPFNKIRNIFEKNYPEIELPKKGWEVMIAVYKEGGETMAEMNFQKLDPQKINIYFRDKYLFFSGNEDKLEEKVDLSNCSISDAEQSQSERIISFPKVVKKVVITAVLNMN